MSVPIPEPLTLGQLCWRSLTWSLRAGLVGGGIISVLALIRQLSTEGLYGQGLLLALAWGFLVTFALLWPVRMLWLSRSLQDRAFAWFGFLCTFSGLGILVLFFVGLSLETLNWFRVSPRLIEYQNFLYQEKLREAEFALAAKQTQLDAELLLDLPPGPILEFFQNRLQGKWQKLLAEAEMAAGMEKKADLDQRMKQVRENPNAVLRNAILADKVHLTQQYLRKKFSDFPKAPDPEMPHPLDDAVYASLNANMMEFQSVMERLREAELGIRSDQNPTGLFYHFLTSNPSNVAQDAGLWPAMLGSLWLALITILAAVPIGVGAAIYLEEYKITSWWGRIIQININNLAGVPSVVFGILGGFAFVEMIFKPMYLQQQEAMKILAENSALTLSLWDRFLTLIPTLSARNVLGGGLTLALLTLPVVIVASQEAIRAVPVSIRHGALALGATKWQTIWHQVLPQARPGILTGTILSISRAIGEAAPLVLFGALLLVQQPPSLFSGFTVIPMQIFGWADRPGEIVPVANHLQLRVQHVAGAVGFLAHDHPLPALGLLASPKGPGSVMTATSNQVPAALPTQTIEIWRYNAAVASLLLLAVLLGLNATAIFFRTRSQKKVRA